MAAPRTRGPDPGSPAPRHGDGHNRVAPRGRAPSMMDVASAAGVSHQTVSRVLNDSPLVTAATRARVLVAVEQLGYRRNNAARALARDRSGRIGMISSHMEEYGPSRIAVAVQEAGHAAGYDVSLVAITEFSERSMKSALDRLLDEAVEALVVGVAHRLAMERVLSLDLAIPVVVVQGVGRDQAMAAGVDQELGARLATQHLLDRGHRRIAHVTGPMDWIEAGQRRAGWQAAHEAIGVLPGPELAGDWSARSGYGAGLRIASDPEVTAVFAANDSMALGLFKALHERGRAVPGDISVVGFDDNPDAAFYWPSLTTVRQNFSALGSQAVDLTLRALAGEALPSAPLIEPTLVVRDSTAAL
jgi:DNA-binding LacI/PurR family transcriptional regulator